MIPEGARLDSHRYEVASSHESAKIRPPQSVYDAVARRSQPDRYLRRPRVNPETGQLWGGRPVAPEEVLADRWRRQLKRLGEVDDEDNDDIDKHTKLTQTGLALSGERDEALPDSVCAV